MNNDEIRLRPDEIRTRPEAIGIGPDDEIKISVGERVFEIFAYGATLVVAVIVARYVAGWLRGWLTPIVEPRIAEFVHWLLPP